MHHDTCLASMRLVGATAVIAPPKSSLVVMIWESKLESCKALYSEGVRQSGFDEESGRVKA